MSSKDTEGIVNSVDPDKTVTALEKAKKFVFPVTRPTPSVNPQLETFFPISAQRFWSVSVCNNIGTTKFEAPSCYSF